MCCRRAAWLGAIIALGLVFGEGCGSDEDSGGGPKDLNGQPGFPLSKAGRGSDERESSGGGGGTGGKVGSGGRVGSGGTIGTGTPAASGGIEHGSND